MVSAVAFSGASNLTIMKPTRILTLLIISLGLFTAAFAADAKPQEKAKAKKSYPLTTCIVTENDLDSMGGAVTKVYDGQEIKFCCKPCVAEFEANQAEFLKKLPK